ncbi:hypothetical protein G4B88_026100 [Cannabis sativa]|uniref:CCHC-type domain-containing protein n=1 Tax=Cannabis sativa TaxID=3483 RepID=A0A7J6EFT6_CANSA|nr:hypothetical protein G4B88_026100 [Cannabis sativa]
MEAKLVSTLLRYGSFDKGMQNEGPETQDGTRILDPNQNLSAFVDYYKELLGTSLTNRRPAMAEPGSWVQFKYEKLPFLCFKCGMFAHVNRECIKPTAWVNPASGPALKMYGPWIKTEGPRGSCFNATSFRRGMITTDKGISLFENNNHTKGRWRRQPSR